jgi:hypothetical protein
VVVPNQERAVLLQVVDGGFIVSKLAHQLVVVNVCVGRGLLVGVCGGWGGVQTGQQGGARR